MGLVGKDSKPAEAQVVAKVGHQAKPPPPEKDEATAPAKPAAPAGAPSTPTKDPEGTTNMELEPSIVTQGSPQKTAKQDREAEEVSPNRSALKKTKY